MQATAGEPTAASIKDVLYHHLKCLGEGDLEGVLADYSPDAVLFMPSGVLKGPDEMKAMFQATDTFVVRNGKIVAQSFAAKITPKS